MNESGECGTNRKYVVRSFETCDTSAGRIDFRLSGTFERCRAKNMVTKEQSE